MPGPFARVHACSTNDHGSDNDKIKGWIEYAGGTYTTSIMPNTTHLLCSKSAWKRYTPLVKEARRTKKIKIVKLEWLVMSLTKYSKRAKIRPLPTTEWEWDQRKLIKAQKNQNNSRNNGGNDSQSTSSSPQLLRVLELEKMGRTFEHALQRLEIKMSDNGYTLFTDRSGFRYSLTLLRKDTRETLARYSVRNPLSPPAIRLPSTLHSCPLPLCHLPPGSPLSGTPIVPYRLPTRLLRTAAPRRVPISDPPLLLALQLYQSDERPKPRYALASITCDGLGQAVTQDLAPMGTTEAFALELWRRVFVSRTGRKWDDRRGKGQNAMQQKHEHVWDGKQVLWTLMDGVEGEVGASASDALRPANAIDDTRTTAQRRAEATSSMLSPVAAVAAETPAKAVADRTMSTGKSHKPGTAATPKSEGSARADPPKAQGPAKGSVLAGCLKDIE